MGKTRLKREVIRHLKMKHPLLNIYHLDTKKRGDYTRADGQIVLATMPPPAFATPGNTVVWQPISDNRKMYDQFFRSILDAGLPAIVDIDETKNLKFGQEPLRELGILLAQGRLPGIHVISATQQVSKSPTEMAGQSTYLVSFFMQNDYDKRAMANEMGISSEDIRKLKKYQFYFMNTDIDSTAKKFNHYADIIKFIR